MKKNKSTQRHTSISSKSATSRKRKPRRRPPRKGFPRLWYFIWSAPGKKPIVRPIRRLCVLIILISIVCLGRNVIVKMGGDDTANTEEVIAQISQTEPEDLSAKASICVAGDIMLHSPFLSSSYYYDAETDTYDFSDIFRYIKNDYQSADYTVCTFEGSLVKSNFSGYPMFRTPSVLMKNLKNCGIDLCLLANNHIYDAGDDGLAYTTSALDTIGLDYTGIRKSTSNKNYKVVDINGIKVGMVDYVYETNSENGAKKSINAIDVNDKSVALINSFSENNLDAFYAEIKTAYENMKADGAEFCISYMHWGIEYQTTESEIQDKMAQNICNIGFNAIIGSHPHVEQPIDLLTSKDGSHKTIVCYAIGNHLSNQRKELLSEMPTGETEDGFMVRLTLTRDAEGNVSVTGTDFLDTWVYRYYNGNSCQYYILPLNNVDKLANLTSIADLGIQPQNSKRRTDAIIGAGANKVQAALPIF